MSKGIWLVVHFNGKVYDIRVNDIDEYSFMCFVEDLEVEGYKQNVIPANNPCIKYYPPRINTELVEVRCDVNLIKMFSLFKRKEEIHVWVTESDVPSNGVQVYKNLKSLREKKREGEEKAKKKAEEEERIRTEWGDFIEDALPITKEVPVFNVVGEDVTDVEFYRVDVETGQTLGKSPMKGGNVFRGGPTQSKGESSGSKKGPNTFGRKSPQPKNPPKKGPTPKTCQNPDLRNNQSTCPINQPQTLHRKKLDPRRSKVTTSTTQSEQHPCQPSTPTQTEFHQSSQAQSFETHSQPILTQKSQTKPTETSFQADPIPFEHEPSQTKHNSNPSQTESAFTHLSQTDPSTSQRQQTDPSCYQTHETNPPCFETQETNPPCSQTQQTDPPDPLFPETQQTDPPSQNKSTNFVNNPVRREPQKQQPKDLNIVNERRDENHENENVSGGDNLPVNLEEQEEQLESYMHRVYRNRRLYIEKPFGQIELNKWDIFLDKEHLVQAVRDYSIQVGADLIRSKVDTRRFNAICANEDCHWRIYASMLPDNISWAIKTLDSPHTCERLAFNSMANINWLTFKVMDDVRANFEIPCKSLQQIVREKYHVTVPLSTMYKARAAAIKQIQGAHDDSYGMLPHYVVVMKETNPDVVAYISWNNQGPEMPLTFKRIFISFGAQYKGFAKGCRPLIGIDGYHLKGNFNGCLLSAIALDANQQIFPIAYAVVSEESKDSWTYFFRCLRTALADSRRDDWTFMSDRMKGVEGSLAEEFPRASRRICCRHLFKNFCRQFPGPYLEAYFWQAANAYNEWVFTKAMDKMKGLDPAAYHYLREIDLKLWTRFKFDPTIRCDDNTNNFTESFNATLGLDRVLPIMTIRRNCMVRIAIRQATGEEWQENDITPYAKNEIKKANDDSRFCQLHCSGRGEWEVVEGRTSFPLNMVQRTCMCGRWQISGIPCKHACRVINNNRQSPAQFVSKYYSVAYYRATYDLAIHPMPDPTQWPPADIPFIAPLK
ncbi:Protein FAR1-RELATED SEQUENCE 6 [Bienertia sinuspersici]